MDASTAQTCSAPFRDGQTSSEMEWHGRRGSHGEEEEDGGKPSSSSYGASHRVNNRTYNAGLLSAITFEPFAALFQLLLGAGLILLVSQLSKEAVYLMPDGFLNACLAGKQTCKQEWRQRARLALLVLSRPSAGVRNAAPRRPAGEEPGPQCSECMRS